MQMTISFLLIAAVEATSKCRNRYPIDVNMCDLRGLWYWTLTSEINPNFAATTCHKFQAAITGKNTGVIDATLGNTYQKELNSQYQVEIKNRQLIMTAPAECGIQKYAWQVALVEPGHICFYRCGPKETYDHAQCFSRTPGAGPANRERLLRGLQFFGLRIPDKEFHVLPRCQE